MELRQLGNSGLQVSIVGLGCNNFGWRIDLDASRKVIDRALELGITLLDTADIYGNFGGSEAALGEILGARRKEIVLATKFGIAMDKDERLKGASRRYIMRAVEASLKRLKTDWIDLYQVHRPDPLTPIEETLGALDDLVRQGKVRYIGCSNYAGWQVADAAWTARDRLLDGFISCQDEYSLVMRDIERELLPAMQHYGIGLLPYFPLASGLLSGKYKRSSLPMGARLVAVPGLGQRYLTEENWRKVEALEPFAAARGHSLLDLAFAWLLARAKVASVIAGATTPEQVEQNVKAAEWELPPADMAEIDKITAKPA
jgi:aryl-alcohol dehydrogenase-like predicted oxidoreductase